MPKYWFEEHPSKVPAKPLTAISLFSGCGGFCEGIKRAGFKILCSVELDPHACATYRHNFPDVPLIEGSVADFLKKNRDQDVKQLGLKNVDLVFGGPPCQGFSQIGPRNLNDQRNSLYEEYARVVETLKPKVFLMENVPNLVLMNKGQFRDAILQKFQSIGYKNASYIKVKASDYGVPQDRYRVIFMGTKDGEMSHDELKSECLSILASLQLKKPFTVWDAIGDLPPGVVPSGEILPYPKARNPNAFQKLMRLDRDTALYSAETKRRLTPVGHLHLHNHHTKEIQARRIELISHLKQGMKGDSLPKEIWNGMRPEKWRRLHPAKPAYTILAQMHRDLSEWVHPNLERWITVREAARLQSFHDGFIFVGSEWQQLKQIGNAVPPLLGAALGRLARALISKR